MISIWTLKLIILNKYDKITVQICILKRTSFSFGGSPVFIYIMFGHYEYFIVNSLSSQLHVREAEL